MDKRVIKRLAESYNRQGCIQRTQWVKLRINLDWIYSKGYIFVIVWLFGEGERR